MNNTSFTRGGTTSPLLLLGHLTFRAKDALAKESEQVFDVCFYHSSSSGLSGKPWTSLSLGFFIQGAIVFASLFHRIAYKDLMKSFAEVLVNCKKTYQASISIVIIAEVCTDEITWFSESSLLPQEFDFLSSINHSLCSSKNIC